MDSDLHHAFSPYGKAIVTGGRNVCAEHGKTFGSKEVRIVRPKMKNGMTGRPKELARKREEMWCPGSGGNEHDVGFDPFAIGKHHPFDAVISLVQLRKLAFFLHRHPERCGSLQEAGHGKAAFGVTAFRVVNSIMKPIGIPG